MTEETPAVTFITITPQNNPDEPKLFSFFQKRSATVTLQQFTDHEPGKNGMFAIIVGGYAGYSKPDKATVANKQGSQVAILKEATNLWQKYFICSINDIEEWDMEAAKQLWPYVWMSGDI